MSLNTTPRTWVSGEIPDAPDFNTEVRDAFEGLQAEWDDWTPTLTGFTVGNGTQTARWRRVGRTVEVRYCLVAGTTSSFTGTFSVSLPAPPAADYVTNQALDGSVGLYDNSAGSSSRQGGTVLYAGSDAVIAIADNTAPATVTNTNPWTWANGDILTITATYEAAS